MHQREIIEIGMPSIQDIEEFIVEIEESKGWEPFSKNLRKFPIMTLF